MCGRFAIFSKPQDYIDQLGLDESLVTGPQISSYNAYPTQSLPIIYRQQNNELHNDLSHWGLVPSWAKNTEIGFKTSNARSETAADKPSFRHAYSKQRCLIPIDGWYEWQRNGSNKQPFYHFRKDQQVIWLGGLWENWDDPASGETLKSFSILTQQATGQAQQIHHRMPVFISPQNATNWLDKSVDNKNQISQLITHLPDKIYTIHPVNKAMNSPSQNNPNCIQALEQLI